MITNLEPILASHPFFKELAEPYRRLIAGCAANVRFAAGQAIFRQDEEANHFYVIRQGKVAVEVSAPNRAPLIVQTLSDGEILGWSWLVPPYRWHFDAQAVELTRAIALDAQCLRRKCAEDHSLGFELLSRLLPIIGQRMEATRLQLLDIYGTHTP